MIKVKNLEKEFKVYAHKKGVFGAAKNLFSRKHSIVKAVSDINFEITQGECVGYLGPNGAGKSTTIKMLTGILVPSSGEVRVNDIIPYEDRQQNAKTIGVVFGQRTQLWWDLPPIESFDLLGKIYRTDPKRLKENMDFFINELELEPFLNTPVRGLSLGQKMRCELTAALLHDPDVLYLDEPTIGLDVVAKERIRAFLKRMNEERKMTIMLTTHDLDDVESLCKRVMVIDHGKLIHDDSLDALRTKYGKFKLMEVDFESEVSPDLPNGCQLLKVAGHRSLIEFDTEVIRTPELINWISKRHPLVDLSVQERPIEDVIKRVYQS
jgi:ABC-2 type transport system ATP-binding protein